MSLAIPTRSQTSVCYTFLKVEILQSARQMSDDSHVIEMVRMKRNENRFWTILDFSKYLLEQFSILCVAFNGNNHFIIVACSVVVFNINFFYNDSFANLSPGNS